MDVNRTELSPLLFLERAARVHASRTAAVYGRRRFTYADLGARVRRLATALRRAGLCAGDRVAFLAPNVPALLEAHFGVALAGGVLVAINTRLNADEVGYILGHSGARFFFVDAELGAGLGALATGARTITIDDPEFAPGAPPTFGGPEYEAFIDVPPDESLACGMPAEDDLYSINYTSGTTGRPKGVMYTHRGSYLNALAQVAEAGMGGDSVYLWTLPMFHCNGWCFPWAVAAVAGTNVCLRRVEPGRVWDLFDTEGVTHYCGAPTVQISLVNDPKAHRF